MYTHTNLLSITPIDAGERLVYKTRKVTSRIYSSEYKEYLNAMFIKVKLDNGKYDSLYTSCSSIVQYQYYKDQFAQYEYWEFLYDIKTNKIYDCVSVGWNCLIQ